MRANVFVPKPMDWLTLHPVRRRCFTRIEEGLPLKCGRAKGGHRIRTYQPVPDIQPEPNFSHWEDTSIKSQTRRRVSVSIPKTVDMRDEGKVYKQNLIDTTAA